MNGRDLTLGVVAGLVVAGALSSRKQVRVGSLARKASRAPKRLRWTTCEDASEFACAGDMEDVVLVAETKDHTYYIVLRDGGFSLLHTFVFDAGDEVTRVWTEDGWADETYTLNRGDVVEVWRASEKVFASIEDAKKKASAVEPPSPFSQTSDLGTYVLIKTLRARDGRWEESKIGSRSARRGSAYVVAVLPQPLPPAPGMKPSWASSWTKGKAWAKEQLEKYPLTHDSGSALDAMDAADRKVVEDNALNASSLEQLSRRLRLTLSFRVQPKVLAEAHRLDLVASRKLAYRIPTHEEAYWKGVKAYLAQVADAATDEAGADRAEAFMDDVEAELVKEWLRRKRAGSLP